MSQDPTAGVPQPSPPHGPEGRSAQPAPGPSLPGRPPQRRKRRRRTAPPYRGTGPARVYALEASAAIHLAVVLLLLAWPHHPATVAEQPQQEPIPIEVAFTPEVAPPAPKPAPPGPPEKQITEPKPQAPERPKAPSRPMQAEHPRPDRPRPATVAHHPAPQQAQKAVSRPKAPDLQTLLNQRMNQGRTQDESQLSHLRDKALRGAEHGSTKPAGAPQGDPATSGSGLTGALASRTPLRQVFPKYPGAAARIGEEGEVRLRLWVQPSGAISRVEVVRSSGHGYFDGAAIDAIRQWSFNALSAADAGDQWGEITLYFRLQ